MILFKTEKGWVEDDMRKSMEIIEKLKEKFKHIIELDYLGNPIRNPNIDIVESYDIGKLNDFIGFMIYDERYNVIFKHKPLTLSSSGRIQKGKSCDKGFTKNELIRIINKLHKSGTNKRTKYMMEKSNKRLLITKIYGEGYIGFNKRNAIQRILLHEVDSNDNKILSKKGQVIGTKQLCIEIELLFRYYNLNKLNDKIWFLSEIESNINKIENIGI
mgnify:CR=1 FL=1